jgi:NADH dehydrogenase
MILVTGATGFIGRSLGRALDRAGIPWRAYSGRMSAADTLRAELEGVATVIHLASAEARGQKRLLRAVDVQGTETLVKACRATGVNRIIMPSRLYADPHALHALLKAKGEAERIVRQGGIPYTILRTTTLFGRGDRFSEIIFGLALWSWPFVWLPGGGRMPVQPLWVEDYIQCLLQSVDRPETVNQVMTVGGAERMTYRQLVDIILNVTGRRRIGLPLPLGFVRWMARFFLGWWFWPPVSRFFIDRLFAPELTELDAAQRQFEFQPARFGETITYLNRPRMRWRLFRR